MSKLYCNYCKGEKGVTNFSVKQSSNFNTCNTCSEAIGRRIAESDKSYFPEQERIDDRRVKEERKRIRKDIEHRKDEKAMRDVYEYFDYLG